MMKNLKVKLALFAAGFIVLLAVAIFIFIKLSLIEVPTTVFTRKDVQRLPLPYVQIVRLLKWNQKILVGIGAYDEFKLFVLESNNKVEPFHRISPGMSIRDAHVDKQNRLILSGVKNGEFCINVLTGENKLEVTSALPKRISDDIYPGIVQTVQAGNPCANSAFTSTNRLFWLNEPEGKLYCWQISPESAKALPTVFLPAIAKLEIPSSSKGVNSNFWRIWPIAVNEAMISDCLGNSMKIDLKSMHVSKISPPKPGSVQLMDASFRANHKDKLGRIWEIRDLQRQNNGEINCEIVCLEGKKVVQRSTIHGSRNGQMQANSSFVENFFGAFHFHNLKESTNWNYPPTYFSAIFEDKLGNIYLRTTDEGFFKLKDNKWVRYSSPDSFNIFGPTLAEENQIIMTGQGGQILRYHLQENTCESLSLTTESNSDPYNRGPGLVGYPVRPLRMENVIRDHPQQVYPRYSY